MLKFCFMTFVLIHLIMILDFWWMVVFNCCFMILLLSFSRSFGLTLINSWMLLDKMSILLIFLTLWIFILSIMCSNLVFLSSSNKLYMINLLFLKLVLVLTFLVSKFTYFFIFFESSLLPTLYLILGWGMKIERIQSGFYMFFYTLFGSLPMMLSMPIIYCFNFSYSFFIMEMHTESFFFFLSIMAGFMMKMPMFLVHSWLPKAHVEAPIAGSMILAGVLLKLGGYGLIRYLMFLVQCHNGLANGFILISILGGVISGVICFRQTDLKSLVAYSSVSHMSMIVCSIFNFNGLGVIGSIIMMVCHGFCSSSLFVIVNFNYERILSRSILMNKGFLSVLPSLTFWWFMLCSCNMACPPSLNLISEIILFLSVYSWSSYMILFILIMPMVGMIYNLNLFSFTQHGGLMNVSNLILPCYNREYLVLVLHFYPLFFSFLKVEMYL